MKVNVTSLMNGDFWIGQLVNELQREVKLLRKTSEHQTSLIDETSSRLKLKGRFEEELSKLSHEVVILKETSTIQVIYLIIILLIKFLKL